MSKLKLNVVFSNIGRDSVGDDKGIAYSSYRSKVINVYPERLNNKNRWFGVTRNCGIVTSLEESVLSFILFEFEKRVHLPPCWAIAPFIRECPYMVIEKCEKKGGIVGVVHVEKSLQAPLVWNAFRIYTGDQGMVLVDITLGYKRDNYMTIDFDSFMKYSLYRMYLFLIEGVVCFACDWEHMEDHPDELIKEWTIYDRLDTSTMKWETKIPLLNYTIPFDGVDLYWRYTADVTQPHTLLPPFPDILSFTWVKLHCMVLNIPYNRLFRTKVSYVDNNPKNLIRSNLKTETSVNSNPGVYIKHGVKDHRGERSAYSIYADGKERKVKEFTYSSVKIKSQNPTESELDDAYEATRMKRLKARHDALQYYRLSMNLTSPSINYNIVYPLNESSFLHPVSSLSSSSSSSLSFSSSLSLSLSSNSVPVPMIEEASVSSKTEELKEDVVHMLI